MLNRVFLIILLLFGINECSFSQKFSIETLVGTYLNQTGYRTIAPEDGIIELRDLSYGGIAGVQSEYQINDYLSVGLGFRWQFLKFDAQDDCFYCDRIEPFEFFRVRKWDIPIYVQAFVLPQTKKVAPYFATGISNQFVKIEYAKEGYKLHWNLGTGVIVNLNEAWAMDMGVEYIINAKYSYLDGYQSYYDARDLILRFGVQRRL